MITFEKSFLSLKDRLDFYLQNKRLNRTVLRYVILNFIKGYEDFFSVKDLHEECDKYKLGITVGMIISVLDIFVEADILERKEEHKKKVSYRLIIE